jgi:ATP-dependent helicase HepA
MTNDDNIRIQESTGNVFADLGLPDPEDRLAKAELAHQIAKIIRGQGQSQKDVAALLGIDQPKVSALLAGRLSGFSLERLANFLTLLGKDVEIAITDMAPTEVQGRLTVGPTPEPLFQIGRLVQLRADPTRSGPIIEILPPTGGKPRYRVFHSPTEAREYHEDQLAPLQAADSSGTDDQWKTGLNGETFRARLTASRLSHSLVDTLYSWQAARIQSIPFQYKPLLRFLRADQPRLLIADEVGVGKTIEAGLVLKELEARGSVENVLIVCPKALTEKWRMEMRRFDEDFQVLTAQSLRYCLDEARLDGIWPLQYGRVIAPLELLRIDQYLRGVEDHRRHHPGLLSLAPAPHFSLLIVDEAHHLRNTETSSHELARFLCDASEAVLFLSATPVHTGSRNLYALLRLLRPDVFLNDAVLEEMLAPAPAITTAMRVVRQRATPDWATHAATALDGAALTSWGRQVLARDPRFLEWHGRLHADVKLTDAERIRCLRDLEDIQPLAHVMNRTRRRDIGRFTVRDPHTVSVPFTADQARLYQALLAYRQDVLLLQYDPQIVRLITDTLERQAASCLPALIPAMDTFLRTGRFASHALTDDPEAIDGQSEISLPPDLVALGEQLRRLAENLSPADPKLDRLLEITAASMQAPTGDESSGKLLVFSFFLHTLRYLFENLRQQGYRVGLITGQVEEFERERLRERFSLPRAQEDAIDVLLSSEVGCEGLDYQFCDRMVNYDIPWNPMRIEQRIGRIDRYGQKSEKVQIFNFITPGTVEERIFFRCFDRLNVFRDTIGDLEEVLGEVAQDLSRIALDPSLSPAQAEERATQLADNALRLVEEERRLEAEGGALLGLDQQFAEDVNALVNDGSVVSADELRQMLTHFLELPLFRARLVPNEPDPRILRLRMGKDGKTALLDRVRALRRTDRSTAALVHWLQSDEPHFELTFDQTAAVDRRDIPFVTPVHPLARIASAFWQTDSGALTANLVIRDNEIPSGQYLFVCDLWESIAVRPELRLMTFAWESKAERLVPAVSNGLLRVLRRAETVGAAADGWIPDSMIVERGLQELEEAAHEARLAALQQLRSRNGALVMQRLASLDGYYRHRLERVATEAASAKDALIRRMKEGERSRIEIDHARKHEELERRRVPDIISQRIAFGSLEVLGEPTKGRTHAS